MKVALFHDYLNQYGGAERVLEELLALFPEADVYTLLYDKERSFGRFEGRKIYTSFLDHPIVHRNHRPFIPILPFAAQDFSLRKKYDLIISDTAGFAKGFGRKQSSTDAFHLSYIHTPLRYAWETNAYFQNPIIKILGAPAFRFLRAWDKRTARRPDVILTNSHHIKEKIKTYYGRDSVVVPPPIRDDVFYFDPSVKKGGYALAVGRILPYKKFDLILDAWQGMDLPLKIIGTGPEIASLQAKGKRLKLDAEFLGFIKDDNEVRKLYAGANVFIFPQVEDFGLVAAEAIACGTPVVAFKGGGAEDIIQEGINGLFFEEQITHALRAAVERGLRAPWNYASVAATADKFKREVFRKSVLQHIPAPLALLS